MNRALAIFLKEPTPGKVKTRLARGIGKGKATDLYKAIASDVLEQAAMSRLERWAFYSPPRSRLACEGLAGRFAGRFRWVPQSRGGLGSRLAGAFDVLFGAGAGRAAVVGSDVPQLGKEQILAGFQALESADLVLGPSLDGGYYLIGLRSERAARLRQLLRDIPWSTGEVLRETLRRARSAGLTFELLEPLLDVDTPRDLARLARSLRRSRKRDGEVRRLPIRTARTLGINPARRGSPPRTR